MESNPPRDDIESRLFERWLAGELSPSEVADLEARLLADDAFRRRYIEYVDLEACLIDEFSHRPEPVTSAFRSRSTPDRRGLWAVIATSAAALLALILVPRGEQENRAVDPAGKTELVSAVPQVQVSRRVKHVAAPLQGLPDVAVITAFGEVAGQGMSVGTRLKPGVLTLREGDLQLDFLGGARVLLRGPAELHLVSTTAATLVNGTAGVRMPFSQDYFTLTTPEAAVVGAWNEYGVHVSTEGKTRVQVLAGAAEVSLLGDDGTSLTSERLLSRNGVDVDAVAQKIVRLETMSDDWPRVLDLDQAQLVVTADYVREVEQSKPYLYWRFEQVEDGRIPDALGGPHAACIVVGNPAGLESVRIVGGAAEFLPSSVSRCIVSETPVSQFNSEDFTIELWAMPAEVKASAIFSTVLPNESPAPLHLNFIEVAHNTRLVHKPGVIRFLHRQPPSQAGGYNLFSQDVCIPGVWTHIVATKTPSELRLYINGQLIRSVTGPGTGASDELDYRLVLGQLGTSNLDRQFHGLIDEVAVYHRALRADEISRHYWSIRRHAPLAAVRPEANNAELALRDGR